MTQKIEDCAICLDTIKLLGCLDSCQHYYCYDCILKWSQSSNTCPLCKKRFSTISRSKPSSKKRASPPSAPTPNKKQKIEHPGNLTRVPFRDLQETHGYRAEGNVLFELLLRAFMGHSRAADGGVIDLTAEEAPRNNFPLFSFPQRDFHSRITERIDVTDNDLPMTPRPLQAAMVIDLTED